MQKPRKNNQSGELANNVSHAGPRANSGQGLGLGGVGGSGEFGNGKLGNNSFGSTKPLLGDKGFLLKALVVGGIILVFFLVVAIAFFAFRPSSTQGIGLVPSGIAIIPIKGEISNDSGGGSFGNYYLAANDIVATIDDAEKNPQVGAIFLDIDSPGGEVIASKQIAFRVRDAKKPVYSYINSVGASGAYYVAAASSHIMADEDSMTGSIGVISIVPNFEGLMEKLGLKMNVLVEGEYKDMGSPFREMNAEDKRLFQEMLSQIHSNFKADVVSFRQGKLTSESMDELADGRIFTGSQALDLNLIDEVVQTRKQAIMRAGELAGIKAPYEVPYEKREFSLYDLFFSAGSSFGSGFVNSINAQASSQRISVR